MLAQTSIKSGSFRSAFGGFRGLAGGLIVSLAAASIITGLGMSDLTARTVVDPFGQTVNRALKGDRLPLKPVSRSDVENQPIDFRTPRTWTPDLKLPDGCEAMVSSIANSELAQIAGRCVS